MFSLRQLDDRNTNQPGVPNSRRLRREAGHPQGILKTCYEPARADARLWNEAARDGIPVMR
jgi:hypothetical protein